jgi:hypothetical protein
VVEWQKIKAEYISGGTSYRKLAAKYGVPFSNLKNVAIKEQWTQLREQAKNRTDTKLVDNIGKQNAKIDDKYYRLVDKLLDKAEVLIDQTNIWQPTTLKELATAMKYLKECKGVKSEADMREQEARIKKLEMEAAFRQEDDDKPSGVVLMPAITEELNPPTGEGRDG